jgi:hypothetical protein
MKYFADDCLVIPEHIQNMTKKELDEFIQRKETEIRKEKEQKKVKQTA